MSTTAATQRTSGGAPAQQQEEVWGRFQELGRRRDFAELERLFASGTAPRALDGPTDGILVAPMIRPGVDRAFASVTTAWMPWMGKSFDRGAERGTNLLTTSAKWPSKLLWPLYRMRAGSGGQEAFDFETRVAPGAIEPAVNVLKIDYSVVSDNPRVVIRSILDELVEIAPDTYLGRILWRRGGRYTNIGYFALRQPPGSAAGQTGTG